jgi:MoxR-like ATPase
VTDPGGEGRIASDGGALRKEVDAWRATFDQRLQALPSLVVAYAVAVTTALNAGGIRISPRRARLLARSLLAATIVAGKAKERLFRGVLGCSLPQACWGEQPAAEAIAAAHRAAWDSASHASEAWVHAFLAEARLDRKLALLLDNAKTPDAGSQAIAQCLLGEPKERAGAFAYAIYPAAALGRLPIGAEGVNDLAKVAAPILSLEGEITWSERIGEKNTSHPEIARIAKALAGLQGARAERAQQFFSWCMVSKLQPAKPTELEREIEGCVQVLRERGLA